MHMWVLKAIEKSIGPDDKLLLSPAANAIHLPLLI